MRDCYDCEIMLFSITDPIIESSTRITFIPFIYKYQTLAQQMESAKLSVWNNNWSEVYDFTPKQRGKNYSLFEEKVDLFIPTFEEVEDDIMRAQTGSMSLSQI